MEKGKQKAGISTEKEIELQKLKIEELRLKIKLLELEGKKEIDVVSQVKAKPSKRTLPVKAKPVAPKATHPPKGKGKFSERNSFIKREFEEMVTTLNSHGVYLSPATIHKILGVKWASAKGVNASEEKSSKLFPFFECLDDFQPDENMEREEKKVLFKSAVDVWFAKANELFPPSEKSVFISQKHKELFEKFPEARLGEINKMALKAWVEHLKEIGRSASPDSLEGEEVNTQEDGEPSVEED